MLVHAMWARSSVNGPGERAVVWFQGCGLHCPDCWNPSSHLFDSSRNRTVEEVGGWILACTGIEGVTFSGGEPFQQAPELRALCEYLRLKRASLSIGVFSGYALCELTGGHWRWKSVESDRWTKGDGRLFEQIRRFLDFGVFGRFRKTMACDDKPLCGSRNQEVVFFSDRYSRQDLQPQGYEVTITEYGGSVIVTGFPPASL